MISRRNFFSIVTLMLVLLFLVMATNDLKDRWNDYAVNTYTETAEKYPSKVHFPWSSGTEKAEEDAVAEEGNSSFSRGTVVLIGDSESIYGKTVGEWAAYSRRKMIEHPSLKSYEEAEDPEGGPGMLVIDSGCIDWNREEEVQFLRQCVEQGTNLVFCTLPDVSVIKDSRQVRDLLGIREVRQEEAAAAGLHLYSGFLLGGERVYLPEERTAEGEEEEAVFPGEVNGAGKPVFPWYLLTSGTKVYMKGIPEEESVDTEEYPVLIWRKSFGTAYVFAVNGGYMKGVEGIGILSAMSAEMHPYEIYPVINAQNMILVGYPSLADENRAEMDRLYGKSLKDLYQESIWTNVRMVMDRYQYKATCMVTPQYDYSDQALPEGEQIEYYLKIFNEASAEVGLSGRSVSDTPIERKLEEDGEFIREAVDTYQFSSFYAGKLSEDEIEKALKTDLLSSVMTVVKEYEDGDSGIVEALSESVIAQTAFDIGFDYTYRGDFLARCLETALGYLSISYDMERVAYPKGEEDTWEKLSVDFGTTVDTFGRLFQEFDRTTVSESDFRIWRFLTLRYRDSRKGDTIEVQVTGEEAEKYFILRTHNETVSQMEGGSWKRLEEGAYLIRADEEEILITLEPAGGLYLQ